MSIWNKVLVGLISVASVVFFYMAARALQTETAWSLRVLRDQQNLRRLGDENYNLVEGNDGIRQKRLDLHKLLLDRRRMWSKCDPKVKAGNDTAEIAVSFDQTVPQSHGIAKGVVLHAFEEVDTQNGGRYLGEFHVTAAAKKQVTIAPTTKLNPREVEKLKTSKGSWVLYEILPSDDNDYNVLFADEQNRRLLLADSIQAVQMDSRLVQESLDEARLQEEACKKDEALTLAEKEKMQHECSVVTVLSEKLEANLNAMQAWIAKLTETNKAMAGQIAKFQLEAARRIDQRTRTMAQSGAGRL